jgi:hypothetical protein
MFLASKDRFSAWVDRAASASRFAEAAQRNHSFPLCPAVSSVADNLHPFENWFIL